MTKNQVLQIRIDPETKTKLQALAQSQGRSVSNLLGQLIAQALAAEKNDTV